MNKFDREQFREETTGDGKVYRMSMVEMCILDKLDEIVEWINKRERGKGISYPSVMDGVIKEIGAKFRDEN